jgi:ATP-dependent helicase Lhr and Lhr-like helicase
MTESEIKQSLRRTWVPFFSRFGRLTPVQCSTIPKILEGENVVVISPAATGKTEAVVAPVIENLLPDKKDLFSILYISPTRALVNDLNRRLSSPIDYLKLTQELDLARKTGDRPKFDEKKPPFLLLTTPESFDSMLCRFPKVFTQLSTVILDELHLLDNTPRGDQLRILLNRLRRINDNLKYYALSATIDDLTIGERYFPDAQVVLVQTERDIENILIPHSKDFVDVIFRHLQERDLHKILCFFNARSYAESYAKIFDRPPFKNKVWVHHASLTKKERERIEALMTQEKYGILCATSTLELGIDIGDIDAVVLFRPPFNVSSLLQRIGRGNRRKQYYLFAIGVYDNPWEKFLFELFFDCAKKGHLYEKRYNPCLSVIPQQIFSYLFQRRRIGTTYDSILRIIKPAYDNEENISSIFQNLLSEGILAAPRNGVYFLTSKLEKKVTYGKIHSNIQEKSFGNYDVYDISNNTHIGKIFYLSKRFILGGRTWEMVEKQEKEKKVLAQRIAEAEGSTKLFEGTGTGGYYYRLASVIKQKFFPDLKPEEFPYFYDAGNIYIMHFLGALYGYILTEAFNLTEIPAVDIEGKVFSIRAKSFPRNLIESSEMEPLRTLKTQKKEDFSVLASGFRLSKFPLPSEDSIRSVIKESIFQFEDNLGSGAFFRNLPEDLQIEDHYLTLDIDGLLNYLNQLKLIELSADQCLKVLTGFVRGI